MKRFREFIKKNKYITYYYRKIRYVYYNKYFVSDYNLIKRRFKKALKREVDVKNPVKFNDKLQWLKLNWKDPKATKCADKYEVRQIIKEKIGEEYLNELYGVYESIDEIDINELPQSFVLKATHASGYNIICKNKDQMNWKVELNKMWVWLKTCYFWTNREWVYKNIKPRIVCEKYLADENGEPPKDYKIFCCDGEPKLIKVDYERFVSHGRNFFDTEWNDMNVQTIYPSKSEIIIQKPKQLSEMLELSRILSRGFSFVRVDFFIVDDKLIFGELTFFPSSGTVLFTQEFERTMGDWIKLPQISNII